MVALFVALVAISRDDASTVGVGFSIRHSSMIGGTVAAVDWCSVPAAKVATGAGTAKS